MTGSAPDHPAGRLARQAMTSAERDHLRRALEVTGTVTEFLESMAGEPIVARKLRHHHVPAKAENALGLPAGELVAARAVVLEGRLSSRAFVYAESTIACGRLPGPVCHRLTSGDDPIGRVLLEEGLSIGREPLDRAPEPPAGLRSGLSALLAASPLVRSYRIAVARTPVIVIDEWFLPAVVHDNLPR